MDQELKSKPSPHPSPASGRGGNREEGQAGNPQNGCSQKRFINPAIIGGGYAGMAAAVALAERGIPVTIFESAHQLGGRARGVIHNDTQLDNGQHLLLGCYRQTLRLIEQVGGNLKQDFLRLPLQLDLHGEFSLRAPLLPAPLHLLVALLGAQGLPFGARLNAARFMLALRRINFTLPSPSRSPSPQSSDGTTSHSANPSKYDGQAAGYPASGRGGERERQLFNSCGGGAGGEGGDMTVADLLAQHGQNAELVQKLWEPLCIAALNTPIRKASAQVLLNVLRDALNRSRTDSDMLLPRIDFTALFPQRAAEYIEQRGGKVFTSCGVEAIIPKDDCIELVTAQGNTKFSHVICATSPAVAAKLLRPIAKLDSAVKQIEALQHQPIYTVYLRYPADVRLQHPMIGLHRRFSQWLFDKGKIAGQHGLIAAVISAEGIHQELSQEQLAQKVIAELREEFGIAGIPEWFKVIAEKRATFCCSPDLHRPSHQTALPGLLLAGDYTAGDYPATLEGAVLSGLRCADLISES